MARSVRRPAAAKATTTKPRKATTTTTTKKEAPMPKSAKTVTAPVKRIAEVPHASFAEGYINRMLDGLTDFTILDTALSLKQNVIMEGPTGSGKTSCVYAWCAARGIPLYAFPSSAAAEPSQFRGRWIQP